MTMNHSFWGRSSTGCVIQHNWVPLRLGTDPFKIWVAIFNHFIVCCKKLFISTAINGFLDQNNSWTRMIPRKQINGFEKKRRKLIINKNNLRFAMRKNHRNGSRIKTSIDIIENRTGHGNRKMEFIRSRNVGSKNRDNITSLDTAGNERRGDLERSTVGIGPSIGGVGVNNGGAVAIDGGSSLKVA
ncbi:unnamed protein product [Amaranthus hypochondriacus]